MSAQVLTLTLDGITADDYLTWVRDPEPTALGRELQSVIVRAQALGGSIEVELEWNGKPPGAPAAAAVAGLPLTPEVAGVHASPPARIRRPAAGKTTRRRQRFSDPYRAAA